MTDGVVSLRGVRVRYGPHTAIDEIDLTVAAGERVALVGPSGAGKTTVLRLCNATVVPSEGTVSVLGCDFATASDRQRRAIRRRVGTVYQQLHLVGPLRVVHNVNAGRLASWGRARALRSLLRPLEVDAARDALTRVGIGDKLYARTEHLSGGEQQRVALARLLRQEPDLILADEPVSSLDPARAEEVMDLLCGVVAQGTRALVVSLHDFALAQRRCDRIVGLREGRIMFDLPASQVDGERASALYRIVG